MSFWNRDLVPQSWGKRRRLPARDWGLLVVVYILSWILTYVINVWIGTSIPESMFTAFVEGGIAVMACIGIWWYPAVADNSPLSWLKLAPLFFLAGLIFLGLELHVGRLNAYQALIRGIPANARWHRSGYPFSFVAFLGSYVFVLTAARSWLWTAVDKCRSGKRDVGGIHPSKDRQ